MVTDSLRQMRELAYACVVPHAVTQLQRGAALVLGVLQVGQRHVEQLEGGVLGQGGHQHGGRHGGYDARVEHTPVGRLTGEGEGEEGEEMSY